MTDSEGAVAVVTGASRGVGKEVAAALADLGARVICVSRTAERFRVDVSDAQQVAEFAKEVEESARRSRTRSRNGRRSCRSRRSPRWRPCRTSCCSTTGRSRSSAA